MSDVVVRPCGLEGWDALMARCPSAGFFDSARWLETFAGEADELMTLAFDADGKTVAALALGVRRTDAGVEACTPVSASFGGYAWLTEPNIALALGVVRATLGHLAETCGPETSLRYAQRPQVVEPRPLLQLEEFCLLKTGAALADARVEYHVDLANYNASESHRRKIRKAAAVLDFSEAGIEAFVAFRRRVTSQQGKDRTVADGNLIRGHEAADGGMRVYQAALDGVPVAMLLEDRVTPGCAIGRNWFHDLEYVAENPTVFLLHSWLETLRGQGVKRASLGGGARMTMPFNPGLAFFKERFKPEMTFRKEFKYDRMAG